MFKIEKDGSRYTAIHVFGTTGDRHAPLARLLEASDGMLYGVTGAGATASGEHIGAVFRLRRDGSNYSVIHSFNTSGLEGYDLYDGMMEGTDGELYGTAFGGGSAGRGVVFMLGRDGTRFTVLHHFGLTDGDGLNPSASLIECKDGALYGTTVSGGSEGGGTVFKLNKDGSGYTILRSFRTNELDGQHPSAALFEGSDGVLYGTTWAGGINGAETVFKMDRDGGGYVVLHTFGLVAGDGRYPRQPLVEGTDGALYSSTSYGGDPSNQFSGGTVFKLNKDGTGYTVLRRFLGTPGDAWGPGGLVSGSDGVLYGTSGGGGIAQFGGPGTIFKLNQDGSAYSIVRIFSKTADDGRRPSSSLVQDREGNLYGTTYGDPIVIGTVFKLNKTGSDYAILRTFSVGENPAAVVVGTQGNSLYGILGEGGAARGGAVFRMSTDGNNYSVLRSFNTIGLRFPNSILDGGGGLLYGTASFDQHGAVFKLNQDGSNLAELHVFGGKPNDGSGPGIDLLDGGDGFLYGITLRGGSNDRGTVFRLNKSGSNYSLLRSFTGNGGDGIEPSSLVLGSDGALYGRTRLGGNAGQGTVFKLNRNGNEYAVIKSSSFAINFGNDFGRLIEGRDRVLYGTTSSGGSDYGGTLYKLNRDGTDYRVLLNFTPSQGGGYSPRAFIEGGDGAIYGTTYWGGDLGQGTVFRFQLAPEVSLRRSPNSAFVAFAGQRGATYELQRAAALSGQWEVIASLVAPPTNTVFYTDTTPPDPAGFYRVRRVP